VLLALGIGGGVMVASSGGSSGGGAAVVAPSNPSGGGGGSGGGNTGGNTGGSTGGATTGALLANGSSSSITTIGKAARGNTSLSGKKLTIGMAPYAPILVSGTTYRTNEEYDTTDINYLSGGNTYAGNLQFISGYTPTNSVMKQTINLASIDASNDFADFYAGPGYVTKSLPTLDITYLKASRKSNGSWYGQIIGPTTYNDITWRFGIWDFALGARILGLQNSEFGYYTWKSEYIGANIDTKRFTRYGADSFYMYKTSKQFTGSNYTQRYGNSVTFKGNIIGAMHTINYFCGSNGSGTHINGNISLSLNLATKSLTGSITNTKIYTYSHGSNSGTGIYHVNISPSSTYYNWYNFTLLGTINTGSSTTPNITFTKVDYDRNQTASITYGNFDGQDLHPLNNNTNFGDAVIVTDGNNVSKDEMVGQINFTGHRLTDGTAYFQNVFLSFGAIKK
ncbi:MAG: hypothetical protein II972_01540, partial [Elusimicrobiaceae bacterium]|nr:hypothetical protein [Elusimicrobiaceae bacterium]